MEKEKLKEKDEEKDLDGNKTGDPEEVRCGPHNLLI